MSTWVEIKRTSCLVSRWILNTSNTPALLAQIEQLANDPALFINENAVVDATQLSEPIDWLAVATTLTLAGFTVLGFAVPLALECDVQNAGFNVVRNALTTGTSKSPTFSSSDKAMRAPNVVVKPMTTLQSVQNALNSVEQLQQEKAALEAEKAALEAEKASLAAERAHFEAAQQLAQNAAAGHAGGHIGGHAGQPAHAAAQAAPQAPRAGQEMGVPAALPTMVINKHLRSGQRIYAQNADLIVVGNVSEGAEVIADGNVHVYGHLRGRAIAGASGDVNARIFCQSMEAEMAVIAGIYKMIDASFDRSLTRIPIIVALEGNTLTFNPMDV